MKLSVVATLYQSAPYLDEFLARMSAAASKLTHDYEIILVNDGSPDNSLERAVEHSKHDPHLTVVDLSRNVGHHTAARAGLRFATGERVFLIDSDLEEVPELLTSFSDSMDATGADLVYGIQSERTGGWFRRWSGAAYYALVNALADIPIPRNVLLVRLMSQRYVQALIAHREHKFAISYLCARTGFQQQAVPVVRTHKPTTSYSLARRWALLIDTLTVSGSAPLKLGLFIGVLEIALSLAILSTRPIEAAVLLLGGIVAATAGLIGKHLATLLLEVTDRPRVIVRRRYGFPDDNSNHP